MNTIKVDFSKVEVEVLIDEFKELDLRKELGNALHLEAQTIPVDDLARTIYYSEGEVEIPENCIEEFKKIVSALSPLRIRRALLKIIDEKLNKEN